MIRILRRVSSRPCAGAGGAVMSGMSVCRLSSIGRSETSRLRRRRKPSSSRLRMKSSWRFWSSRALTFSWFSWSCSACSSVRDQSRVGFLTNAPTRFQKPPELELLMVCGSWCDPSGGAGEGADNPLQSLNIFCLSSRRCCASSDIVAVGRASRRAMPMGSPVSSHQP
ncbi:hypothetical protein GALL_484840 [mine drainage metagenome]|uniref:Uncharacterized protein n=1 Tax=mine drainage metagenome TaxID=410659 RepID=A0A1J5PQ73_9ZZZZ